MSENMKQPTYHLGHSETCAKGAAIVGGVASYLAGGASASFEGMVGGYILGKLAYGGQWGARKVIYRERMRTENKVLVTGFPPFWEFARNPSQDLAKILDGETINGYEVKGIVIPFDYRNIKKNLLEPIKKMRQKYVLMLGQSFDDRDIVSLEDLAKNKVFIYRGDFAPQDHTGYRPENGEIIEGAGDRYGVFERDSLAKIVENLTGQGISAEVSTDAGTNFCNYTYFHVLRNVIGTGVKPLFVHLPNYPEEIERTGLSGCKGQPFEKLNIAVRTIISEITQE